MLAGAGLPRSQCEVRVLKSECIEVRVEVNVHKSECVEVNVLKSRVLDPQTFMVLLVLVPAVAVVPTLTCRVGASG